MVAPLQNHSNLTEQVRILAPESTQTLIPTHQESMHLILDLSTVTTCYVTEMADAPQYMLRQI